MINRLIVENNWQIIKFNISRSPTAEYNQI